MFSQREIRELMDYNGETGVVTWRRRPESMFTTAGYCKAWNGRYAGTEAGTSDSVNFNVRYRHVKVFGVSYRLHRLIWIHVNGSFCDEQIDHIDGDTLNNRIENLRCVSAVENGRNAKRQRNNTSGTCGVFWEKSRSKWRATIMVLGKHVHLGAFNDRGDAVHARRVAEKEYCFHDNHGR